MQVPAQRGTPLFFAGSQKFSTPIRPLNVCRRSILGIDLGTSTSCVAVIEQGKPKLLHLFQGSPNFPSIVTYFQKDEPCLGHPADPPGASTSYASFKRLIGRTYQDAHQDAKRLGYTPREASDGALELHCQALGSWLTPTDIAADLLRGIVAAASKQLDKVTGAVVGVPARFDDGQCQATLQAARAAGLNSVNLLREPIAAALACQLQHQETGAILVFDLGGGTFDLSLLESFEGVLEVLSTSGDTNLGGIDFDAAIATWALRQQGLQQADISADQWRALLAECEAVKRQAMTAGHADLPVAALGGSHGAVRLSTGQLEELMQPTLRRMWPCLQELGNDACLQWHQAPWQKALPSHATSSASSDLTAEQSTSSGQGLPDPSSGPRHQALSYAPEPRSIGQVVLVGGGTKASVIQSLVQDLTGIKAVKGIDPEAVVAFGCATYAGMLMGDVHGCEMVDGSFAVDTHSRVTGF